MKLTPAFTPNYYKLEVITPVFIGGAKEDDYIRGQDYYIQEGQYVFISKRAFQKSLTAQEIIEYTDALINNNVRNCEELLLKKAKEDPSLIHFKSPAYRTSADEIRKHISDGNGKIYIPGSTLKGCLRSIIGVYIMGEKRMRDFNPVELFGKIDNNFMRFIQLTDVTFENLQPEIIPTKIYSGDVEGEYRPQEYKGIGKWKHSQRGGHTNEFKTEGFVTVSETIPAGTQGALRINFGDNLLSHLQHQNKSREVQMPSNIDYLSKLSDHSWMTIAKQHTNDYINKEIQFFDRFRNADFPQAKKTWENIRDLNNQDNTVVLRIGAGSGFHAITGDWQYTDHTKTKQAQVRQHGQFEVINAIEQKTRKVNFRERDDLFFPGFIKLSVIDEKEYLLRQNAKIASRVDRENQLGAQLQKKAEEEKSKIEARLAAEQAVFAEKARLEQEELRKAQEIVAQKLAIELEYRKALTSTDVTFVKEYIARNEYREGIEAVRRHLKEITPAGLPERLASGNLTAEQFVNEALKWKEKNGGIFGQYEGQLKQRFEKLSTGQDTTKLRGKVEKLFENDAS